MARSGILRERETGGRTRVPPPQGEQHALFSLCAHNSTKGEIMYSRMNLHIYLCTRESSSSSSYGMEEKKDSRPTSLLRAGPPSALRVCNITVAR